MIRRILRRVVLVSAFGFAAFAAQAQAATVIGQTAPPGECSDPNFGSQVQLSATGTSYTVPFDGTITGWSAASDAAGVQTSLLVLQPVSGTTFKVVAKSGPGTFSVPGVQTFPAQIPVHAGEVIGDWGKLCAIETGGSDVFGVSGGPEPALGSSPDFPAGSPGALVNLSATVEQAGSTPTKHKKCKKKKHKRSAESAKKKKCKKKKRK